MPIVSASLGDIQGIISTIPIKLKKKYDWNSGDEDRQLQTVTLKHNLNKSCRANSQEAFFIKYLCTPSNEIRDKKCIIADNNNSNTINTWKNTAHIAEGIVKVLYVYDDCPGLRIDHHSFREWLVACHLQVHIIFVNDLSNMEIDETESMICNKTFREGFPDIKIDMIALSDKRNRNNYEKPFRIWTRNQQQEEHVKPIRSGSTGSITHHSVELNPFCTKLFPAQLREENGLNKAPCYVCICRKSPRQNRLMKNRTFTLKRWRTQLDIDTRWIVPYTPTLTKRISCHINLELCVPRLGRIKHNFKYVCKGKDRVIKHFVEARFVSASKAKCSVLVIWCVDRQLLLVRLNVHLEGRRTVYSQQENE